MNLLRYDDHQFEDYLLIKKKNNEIIIKEFLLKIFFQSSISVFKKKKIELIKNNIIKKLRFVMLKFKLMILKNPLNIIEPITKLDINNICLFS